MIFTCRVLDHADEVFNENNTLYSPHSWDSDSSCTPLQHNSEIDYNHMQMSDDCEMLPMKNQASLTASSCYNVDNDDF